MKVKTMSEAIGKTIILVLLKLMCCLGFPAGAWAEPVWQSVSIPELPPGSSLRAVWARTRSEAYVLAIRIESNYPSSFLFRWNGAAWTQVLALTNYVPGKIFGTGSSDLFLSVDYAPNGMNGAKFARIFRSGDNGTVWTEQVLPAQIANTSLYFGHFGGTPNNVHVNVGPGPTYIIRFDGTSWSTVFTNQNIYGLTLISSTEGYYVTCLNWGSWDGANWTSRGGASIGCDVHGGAWGKRENGGPLQMYATGQNNFNNGVRIWRFDESVPTWQQVFSDGLSGNGRAVWGSASNDVYVVGELISGGTPSGRVYHFDGGSWSRVTAVGDIPSAEGISGTAHDDVWISLASGTMLHFAPAPPTLDIQMYAGVTISGEAGATYQLQYTTDLAPPVNWSFLTNLTLPVSPYLFFDTTSAGRPNSFYRAFRVQ